MTPPAAKPATMRLANRSGSVSTSAAARKLEASSQKQALKTRRLAEAVAERAEEQLAEAEGQREGGRQERGRARRDAEIAGDGGDQRIEIAPADIGRETAQAEKHQHEGGPRPAGLRCPPEPVRPAAVPRNPR